MGWDRIDDRLGQVYGHGGVLDESGVAPWRPESEPKGNSPAHGAAGEQEAQSLESRQLSGLSSDYAGAAGLSPVETGKQKETSEEPLEAKLSDPSSDFAGAPGPSPANPNATHLEGQSSVSNKPSSALEQKKAQFQEAVKNNKNDKAFTPQEKALIDKHGLEYSHHNDSSIFLKAKAEQEGHTEAENSDYWYRTMNQSEFNKLNKSKNNGELPRNGAFGGIAPNREYATSKPYLSNNSDGQYTVQFHAPNLAKRMAEEGIHPKGEGGGTYGLGDAGTRPKDSTAADGVNPALGVFNQYASPQFKVVNAKMDNNGRFNPTEES